MAWGALAALAGSLLAGMLNNNDDGNNASSTTTNTPATWNDVAGYNWSQGLTGDLPSTARIWDSMMNDMAGVYEGNLVWNPGQGDSSGTTPVSPPNMDNYGGEGWTPVYDTTGNYIVGYEPAVTGGEGDLATGAGSGGYWAHTPSAAEQEVPYRQGLMADLLASTQGLGADYLSSTGQATQQYQDTMGRLTQPSFNIGLGDQSLGIVPKRNSMLADMAGNMMGADVSQADRSRSINSGLADMTYNLGMENSPVAQQLMVMQQLWPYMSSIQSMRFGLPSSTDTATYNPSAQETLGNITNTAGTLMDLWNSLQSSDNGGGGGGGDNYDFSGNNTDNSWEYWDSNWSNY